MFGMGDLGCTVIKILHQHAQTCEHGLKLYVGDKSPNHSAWAMCIKLFWELKTVWEYHFLMTWVPKSASPISSHFEKPTSYGPCWWCSDCSWRFVFFYKKTKSRYYIKTATWLQKEAHFCHCGPPAWPHCFSPVSTLFSHSCVCSRVRPCSPHQNHVLLLISANIFSSNINSKIWN